jgi:ABC-type multidrug transport system ATPase subunit
MDSHSLQVKNLTKRLNAEFIIKSLNLNIFSGKRIALLGLNGAGKSSLIKLLVGEYAAEQGDIQYYPISNTSQAPLSPSSIAFKKLMGYQADTQLSIAEMDGQTYLKLCALSKGLSEKEAVQAIAKSEAVWPVKTLLKRPMKDLSKGNLQKLAIAQALLNSPEFLFFDEPCQSLDPLEQDNFNRLLANLNDFSFCLFSTHNVNHAVTVADEIILFHQSKIIHQLSLKKNHHYLLVSLTQSNKIIEIAKNYSIEIEAISGQIIQIRTPPKKRIENFEKELIEREIDYEFCMPELQSLVPLFRLLGSGELSFSAESN